MKKALSLLVAGVLAASLNIAVFAADDIPGTAPSDAAPAAGSGATPSTRIALEGADDEIVVGIGELFLVDETDKVVGGIYNSLEPDTEYTFRVYYNNSGAEIRQANNAGSAVIAAGTELTGQTLNGGTIRLRTLKGSSSIQSARIKTTGRGDTARYDLVLNTRNTFGTKITEVEYSLAVTGTKTSPNPFNESSHIFEVGYQKLSDEETDIGEGGYITIANDRPVITKEQFVDIAKSVNYKTVNFEGEDGGWTFVGRVSGMGDSNFYYTYDVVPELINKFPDQEYKFLNFRAGVTFPASGEMRIDVSDVSEEFGTLYTYLYRNGKLTQINSTYDSGANEIVFRTNYLGSFVITDKKITDTSIIVDNNDEEEEEPDEDKDDEDTGSGNPNTGASNAMNIAVTLGLVSLVAAGAVSRKRK